MTMHELAVMNAAAIESDEVAAALFDKFDKEHDLSPAEWAILDRIVDEVSPISDEDLFFMIDMDLIDDD